MKILMSCVPLYGHLLPSLNLACRLRDKGHEVLWANTQGNSSLIFEFGFHNHCIPGRFENHPLAVDLGTMVLGRSRIRRRVLDVFAHWTLSQIGGLLKCTRSTQPDVMVTDCIHLAPLLVARHCSIPSAVLGVTPLTTSSRNVAWFGAALPPTYTKAGMALFRACSALGRLYLKSITCDLMRRLDTRGFGSVVLTGIRNGWVFDCFEELACTWLQCGAPSLEYPRSDRSKKLHFIGPMLPPDIHIKSIATARTRPPRFRVFVTWGTVQSSVPNLLKDVAILLSRRGHDVVVGAAPWDEVRGLPHDIRITRGRLAYHSALAASDVMLSNGGYGGVRAALTFGVPVVCVGSADDKAEVGARVEFCGAGIGLRRANTRVILGSIEGVLAESRYATVAQCVSRELHELDESDVATRCIEELD